MFPYLLLLHLHHHRYVEYDAEDVDDFETLPSYAWENSVLSVVGLGQVMIAAVVASIDHPFRMPWWKNRYLLFAFQFQILLLILINFDDGTKFVRFLDIKDFADFDFSWLLFVILATNLVVSLLSKSFAKRIASRISAFFINWADKSKEINLTSRQSDFLTKRTFSIV